MTVEQLEAARAERMRQNGHGAFHIEDVRTWIEETGLCIFLPRSVQAGFTAPTFVEAVAGQRTAEPTLELIATAEQLLVRLEAEGVAVRLNLGGQPGDQPDYVVAGWVLPYVYALRGDRDWRRTPQLTGSRQVSPLAVQVAKHLELGNMTAGQLRDALGREVTESATLRALHELWKQLRVIPVVSEPGQPALWQPLRQRFQKAIAEGASTSQVTAISVLASIYLQAVIAASMEDVEMFLSPLTSRSKIREVVRGLAATRQVHSTSLGQVSMYYVAGTLPDFPVPTSFMGSTPSYLSRYQKMLQEDHGAHEDAAEDTYRPAHLRISAATHTSPSNEEAALETAQAETATVSLAASLGAETSVIAEALPVSRPAAGAVRSPKPRLNTAHAAPVRPRKPNGGSFSASPRHGSERRYAATSRSENGRGDAPKSGSRNGHAIGSGNGSTARPANAGERNVAGSRAENGQHAPTSRASNRPANRPTAAHSGSGFRKVEKHEALSRNSGSQSSARPSAGGTRKPAERNGNIKGGNGPATFRSNGGAVGRKPARPAVNGKPAPRPTSRPVTKSSGASASGTANSRTANSRTANGRVANGRATDRRAAESRPATGRARTTAESASRKSATKRFSFATPARQPSAARSGSGNAKTASKSRSR